MSCHGTKGAFQHHEVGLTKPHVKNGHSSCGHPSAQQPRRTVSARELHLRYSPRGTSFHYLHLGDEVQVLLANASDFAFVEVLDAAPDGSAKRGARGWVLAESLS